MPVLQQAWFCQAPTCSLDAEAASQSESKPPEMSTKSQTKAKRAQREAATASEIPQATMALCKSGRESESFCVRSVDVCAGTSPPEQRPLPPHRPLTSQVHCAQCNRSL